MKQPETTFETMNSLGRNRIPFLFVIDFECAQTLVLPFLKAEENGIFFNVRGRSNINEKNVVNYIPLQFDRFPVDFSIYTSAFNLVKKEIRFGNSYLLNLTFRTPISINRSLEEIFHLSQAPYKLLFRDEFTVFSPECFIKIENNIIRSFPMKGTIDAGLDNAAALLISNQKELAEHNTIVDLIRNDLSMVATEVKVNRFRYLDEIKTNRRHLLQASSEISGKLKDNWRDEIGTLIETLLPAGSISGAPKKKTVELIKKAEISERGFYTGIFGIFDGESLDSGVMIRFIEKQHGQLFFRSGGGITVNSIAINEYNEMIDKVYVPFV